jgi:hypothetical protein
LTNRENEAAFSTATIDDQVSMLLFRSSLSKVLILSAGLFYPMIALAQNPETASIDSSVVVFEGAVEKLEYLATSQRQIVHKAKLKVLKKIAGDVPDTLNLLVSNPVEVKRENRGDLRLLALSETGRFKLRLLIDERDDKVYRFLGVKDDYQRLKAGLGQMPAPRPHIRQLKADGYDPQESSERWLLLEITLGLLVLVISLAYSCFVLQKPSPASGHQLQNVIKPLPGASGQSSNSSESAL